MLITHICASGKITNGICSVDGSGLKFLWQESGRPDGLPTAWHGTVQDHESGEVLVFATEAVGHPRSHGGATLQEHPGIHLQHGRSMIIGLRIAGIEEGHVINVLSHVRENLRDPGSGFSVLLP